MPHNVKSLLEGEVNRQLRAARAAAAQVGIAAAHVRRRGGLEILRSVPGAVTPRSAEFPGFALPKASTPKPGNSGLLKFG